MNTAKLKSIMILHGETQSALADAMGLPQSALSARMNGKYDFRQNEINFIRKRYALTDEQTVEIFFAK